jgi:phosphatidylinositol 3-kinase
MKLNKEMVEAMGGVDGANFAAFRIHCFTAYSLLRRHHSLFLALLLLMVDASMPNFDDDGKVDPLVNLRNVQEKLRLDLSESEARSFYAGIVKESMNARFTVLWDTVHVIAQNVRK